METTSEQTPLSWGPFIMTEQSVRDLWARLQDFPQIFDDFGKNDYEGFVNKLLTRTNVFIDIGPGVGLACAYGVRPGLDMVLHLVMFDRRLRGREPLFLEIMGHFFEKLKLRRMTAIIVEDCKTAIKLVERLGFAREGCMPQACLRDSKYLDVFLYGILREDFDATITTYSERSTSASAA